MQRTIDERYKDFQAKAASNERAQRELRRVLDNLDKLPEQQSAADLLPIAEMEERLQYVNKLEKYWRVNFAWLSHKPEEVSRDFNDAELSGLLHMDTDYLRDNTARPQDMNTLIEDIQHFPLVLKICKYPFLRLFEFPDERLQLPLSPSHCRKQSQQHKRTTSL